MFIKSKDTTRPLLLYLHGGMPEYFLEQMYHSGLDEFFTVVWWEQRGSGISYENNEAITSNLMISDVIEVTNYLRSRFKQEKIYLIGHSGGSFIGIQAAARAPELYHTYIGVAQMADQIKSEQLAYAYMLRQFRKDNNIRMVRKLESAPVTSETPYEYLKIRDKAMHSLGIGTMHSMKSVITGIFIPSLLCRDYTINEKINLWRAKANSGV